MVTLSCCLSATFFTENFVNIAFTECFLYEKNGDVLFCFFFLLFSVKEHANALFNFDKCANAFFLLAATR